ESSWIQLAEESAAKGEFRLALRALYLAALNHLSSREMVSIRRWKSGLDYRRELERRTREIPQISMQFCVINGVFERFWYGFEGASRETVDSVVSSLNQMRTYASK